VRNLATPVRWRDEVWSGTPPFTSSRQRTTTATIAAIRPTLSVVTFTAPDG
jgi:hypothetical protein